MAARPRIAFVSREVWPFVTGGGIGRHVSEAARVLSEVAEVVVVTTDPGPSQRDGGAPGVRYAWVAEPGTDLAPMTSGHHAWAVAARDVVLALSREDGPFDLIEAEDFRGTAAALVETRRAGAPELEASTVAVRLHTTWEMVAAVDGQLRDDLASRVVMALERQSLRFADVLLAPTQATLRSYRRFYGAEALAPAEVVRPALVVPAAAPEDLEPSDGPLRLVQVGRLQRHKGVEGLVRALVAEQGLDVQLTLLGRDSSTAPGGRSMRALLERLAADDPRVHFLDAVPPEAVAGVLREHDVVVAASLVESFGYVPREGMGLGRPALVAPVGGLLDGIAGTPAGWVMAGTAIDDVRAGLRSLAADAAAVRARIRDGAPRAALEGWLAGLPLAEPYLRLADGRVRRPAAVAPPERVVAVVDATGAGDPAVTARALAAQEGVTVEVLLAAADPGDLRPEAVALAHDLVAVPAGARRRHRALDAAFEAAHARGAEVIVLVRAGDRPAPGFVGRCLDVLAAAPDAPYATAHGTGRDPGNAPLGNASSDLLADVQAGGSLLVLRAAALPRPLPAGSEDGAEETALCLALSAEGAFGVVAPGPLAGRVRAGWRDPRAPARAAAAATPSPAWALA